MRCALQNKNQSHRQKVIVLVHDAVVFYNRAVKLGDLQNYAKGINKCNEFSGRPLTVSIARLVHTGELYIAKKGRRDKYGGCFYLPERFVGDEYTENLPPSWLDIVWQAFHELWSRHETAAKTEGTLPSPLSTVEVEKYILERFGKDVFPADKSPVAYALAYLSRPKPEPVLKKVRRLSFGQTLWVPASVSSQEYSSDVPAKNRSENENMMVRDAVAELGRPVTADEINAIAERTLEFKKYKSISLSYLIDSTAFSLIRRVGLVEGEWYYYYGNISEEDCSAFITVRRCQSEWSHLNARKEVENLDFCKLPAVIFGRLMLVKQTAKHIAGELRNIVDNKRVNKEFCKKATDLLTKVKKTLVKVELRLSGMSIDKRHLPPEITQQTIMLNSEEMGKLLKPLLYKARKYKFDHKVADLIGRELKRSPNPEYRPYFSGNSGFNIMSRYLFDRFDVLIYAAQQVGGSFCRMMSAMAKAEMGSLRDPRFIMPMLNSDNFEHRLGAAACLAFLQIPEYKDRLFQLALNDPDSGVRKVALWSIAFGKGNKLQTLLETVRMNEKNEQVLNLSNRLAKEEPLSI